MKKTNYILAAILMISSFGTFAQSQKINTEKSTINWLGKKIGGQHEGLIKLKNGVLEEKNGKIVSGSFVIDMSSLTNTDLQDEGYNKKLVGHLQNRINLLLSAVTVDRYLEFIKMYPDILLRVPQTMVASYLGITPESLSRVRKDLAQKNFKK